MRRQAPAAARNRQPILDVLAPHLPAQGLGREIASGSGEHIVHFAAALPQLTFQPSDPDEVARASIDDWARTEALANVRRALALDASAGTWPIESAEAVVCINMIHISPWESAIGLMRGAAKLLPVGGLLFLYGPYHRNGAPTSASNADFDTDLRRRNPAWGVRDLEAVIALAQEHGFGAPHVTAMPANNLSLIFRRTATSS